MGVHVEETVDPGAWDEFVSGNPAANVFHTRTFFEIFGNSDKYLPCTFFLMEEDRIRAALFSLLTVIIKGPFANMASRNVSYGGLLLAPELGTKYLMRHLGKLVRAHDDKVAGRTLYTEIRNVEEATRIIPFLTQSGYRYVPHLNYLVDLGKGKEQVWSGFSQSLRKAIRKAEQAGLEIVDLENDEGLEKFHELVALTYAKVHIPCFELEVFRKAWRHLHPNGMLRVTLARDDDGFVASRAALLYKGRVFDWFAGSNARGDATNANALLAWDMMRWGAENGFEVFDFGGAGDPNKPYGVREFKMRFMGELVNYGRFVKIYSRARYLLSASAYGALRRFLY
jgi:hypothetical protein